MESWLSGRKRVPAKDVGGQLPRGFESLTLRRMVYTSVYTPESAAANAAVFCFVATPKGFFRVTESVRDARRGFEPIFLKKFRCSSKFPCAAIFSAWLSSFRKLSVSSNRLFLSCES
jgi:hypothetical protein